MGTVVDIHCHTFNGDDLPVRGFVRGVHFEDRRLGDAVAALVDRLVQARAPGYDDEVRRLDALLGAPARPVVAAVTGGEESLGAVEAPLVDDAVVPDLDAKVEAELRELAASDPYLLNAAAAELEETAGDTLTESEGLLGWGPAAVRTVRWAALYASPRLDNTVHLVRQFGDEVDLFTPMLVDLELGLNDQPQTSVLQQVELQERISRLSMLGRLPGVRRAQVHPFVGFDPRREVLTRQRGDPVGALDVVKMAVTRYGCIGVKLYPPMGFRPFNNARKPGGPPGQDAEAVDEVLRDFYGWCLTKDVPVTAHCNISNGARDAYDAFSDPDDWGSVLDAFPGLHLNLGHFGGVRALTADSWPQRIAELAGEEPDSPGRNLYADVGNHRTDKAEFATFMSQLQELFAADTTKAMAERLLYGSDWYMLAILPNLDDFMSHYREAYQEAFGGSATTAFFGSRALSFLGFDSPANQNCVRLRARYTKYASERMPGWLAGGQTD